MLPPSTPQILFFWLCRRYLLSYSPSTPPILVFFGLAAVIFGLNVAELAILRASPGEIGVTWIFVSMISTVFTHYVALFAPL